MCFKLNNEIELQFAKEDIVCYKVISKNNISIVMHFPYKTNTEYGPINFGYSDLFISPSMQYINEGYHSYTYEKAKSEVEHYIEMNYGSWKMVEFIIPKGAAYYHDNILGKYVSTSIRSGDLFNVESNIKLA